ncbi:hypothetical protein DPMN_088773 [Dreissena polymorpha]|uniref:Uncharacterized protein n=1 Tax=Dreissena polymorpha TaxID=45954 RepID=A0A9D4KUP6_DREPO|nr:hypothetical protein DPMN_088773 [Dreissena polymorpha]
MEVITFYQLFPTITDYELESIKALFNEKEKELALAVTKVEEMTRQLEEIRSGRVKSSTNTQSPAALAELEKLKKSLWYVLSICFPQHLSELGKSCRFDYNWEIGV